MHFISANAKVCGLHYWLFFLMRFLCFWERKYLNVKYVMSMNCLFKGILTTMLDSCLFNINSMTYNPQGLLSTASTVKNKKNPNQQKKKNPHFLQWYWVLTCKSSLRNIWWQMFKKAQTHMTVPHFDYTLITPVVCDLCILRHARLEGIIILNHVNGIQVNSSTSFCKINFGVIILWFIVAWN